jgi:hypothetical protein
MTSRYETTDTMRTYAKARQLIAERNTAVENARFWRRSFYAMAGASLISLSISFGDLWGWF